MHIDIKYYKENGCLLLKGFFQKDTILNILNEAKMVFIKQFFYLGYTNKNSLPAISEQEFNDCLFRLFNENIECLSNCGKTIQHLISLHQLSLQPAIIDLLKQAGLTSPVICTRPVMYFNHPQLAKEKIFYKVDAHQDWRSMQGSLNSAVIWIPLIDINKDLGALEVVLGSHLKGLQTDHVINGFGMVKTNAKEKFLPIEVAVGDILLFSSFLIHRSGENIMELPRWSCHFRYNDLDEETFILRKYAHPYIYKPAEELITADFPTPDILKQTFCL